MFCADLSCFTKSICIGALINEFQDCQSNRGGQDQMLQLTTTFVESGHFLSIYRSLRGKNHAIPACAYWLHESGKCLTYTFGVRENMAKCVRCKGCVMMINTRLDLHIFKKHTLETYKHDIGKTNTSVNCMEKSKISESQKHRTWG